MKKLYVITLLISLMFFNSCSNSENKSIKIGLIAGLSGKYSELGNDVLRGVTLALEEVDSKINNIPVELIIKDDKQDSNIALNEIKNLLDTNTSLIIGNTTSSMTKVSLKEIKDKKDILLISPTASSDIFSNLDDNFLRTQVAYNPSRFDMFSDYLIKNKLLNIAFIYDENNLTYSNTYMDNFELSLKQKEVQPLVVKMKITEDYSHIKEKLDSIKPDLVVVIANSIDSSKLIQYLRINDNKGLILCSAWAKTADFIENGGKYVEDVFFITDYDDASLDKDFLEFVKKYKERYSDSPSLFSSQAYETVKIIIESLKINPEIKSLKNTILNKKVFNGLQGKIYFNKFGDIKRDVFIMSIKNNHFIKKSLENF
ncbi:MAG: ABC transporter substrate-binding protein [Arcobacter sp.]|uniref:ABC transporter substrate-binding protein n=1 Tax=Arcobacter sp. TaxID=1872629 RepID=UPI003B00EC92